MKIHGTDPGTSIAALSRAAESRNVEQSEQAEPAKAGLQTRAGLGADGSVQLSRRAQEVRQVVEAAKAEPEVRADVVEKARADLAAGRLAADPAELAALIVRDLF